MMRRTFSLLSILCIVLQAAAAWGLDPWAAEIRVSSGGLYDYVVIGEHPKASDGFDNAYDTISPGNLNADMGEPFISAAIEEPEWKPALRQMRGDIRALAKRQQWQVSITSGLAKGKPLLVELQFQQGRSSKAVKVTLRDKKREGDLTAGSITIPAPGPGAKTTFSIIAEQP
jgi:hypothetical protein